MALEGNQNPLQDIKLLIEEERTPLLRLPPFPRCDFVFKVRKGEELLFGNRFVFSSRDALGKKRNRVDVFFKFFGLTQLHLKSFFS